LAAVLAPMALLLSRFERPGASERRRTATARAAETPAGRLAVTLCLLLAVLGLFGLVTSGFTPLLDPLRNLACLAAGVLLARAAGTGTWSPRSGAPCRRRAAPPPAPPRSAAAMGSPAAGRGGRSSAGRS
jgi:hypothetical protein